jgi:hypothetical protein
MVSCVIGNVQKITRLRFACWRKLETRRVVLTPQLYASLILILGGVIRLHGGISKRIKGHDPVRAGTMSVLLILDCDILLTHYLRCPLYIAHDIYFSFKWSNSRTRSDDNVSTLFGIVQQRCTANLLPQECTPIYIKNVGFWITYPCNPVIAY